MFDNYSNLEYVIKGLDIEGNYQFAKEHNWKTCVDEYFKMYEEVANG
jgi:hypothetical protein